MAEIESCQKNKNAKNKQNKAPIYMAKGKRKEYKIGKQEDPEYSKSDCKIK